MDVNRLLDKLFDNVNHAIIHLNFIQFSNSNATNIRLLVKVDYLVFVCLPILQKNVIKVIWEMAANEIGK